MIVHMDDVTGMPVGGVREGGREDMYERGRGGMREGGREGMYERGKECRVV